MKPVLVTLLVLLASLGAAAPSGRLPPGRLEFLARGINLNNSWDRFTAPEAAFLKSAGFTVVRLPLPPDLLFDPASPGTPEAGPLGQVDKTIHRLLDAGLAVVFDPIHGSSDNADWEKGLAHDPAYEARVEVYWEALARHYAALSADRIFFEVMNEPHLTAFEKIAPAWWGPVQEKLAGAIRRGAPLNTILVTGERWGGIDGLLDLQPLADPNVVYSFHSYEPFTFTHQGAAWAGPVQAALAGVPYPSNPENVKGPASALADPKAQKQLLQYGKESWDQAKVRANLDRAASWAQDHRVDLFCGEFGAYRKVAAQPDRLRWLADIRRSLEALGIGWAMWDYRVDFGLVTYDGPDGPVVDTGALAALGLDPDAPLARAPGRTSLKDFLSGTSAVLDLPPGSWSSFWSREPGAGAAVRTENADGTLTGFEVTHRGTKDWALGSGTQVPVRPGEILKLSAAASFEGTGSAALELVARDAGGQVVSWSWGRVALGPGPEKTWQTTFAVTGSMATVEPRWSGSGPSTVLVRGFRLERLDQPPASGQAGPVTLTNPVLSLTFEPALASFSVTDLRTGTTWDQVPGAGWTAVAERTDGNRLEALLVDLKSGFPVRLTLTLDPAAPDLGVTVEGTGPLAQDLRYPYPWAPKPGSRLIVPLNEGIGFPADDPAVGEMRLVGYGGHGLSMGFWGVDLSPAAGPPGPGVLTLLETPDDAYIDLKRTGGLLAIVPGWQAQKGQFGYPRKLHMVFFNRGGPAAMALRYRQEIGSLGRLVTLADKQKTIPQIRLLPGAADVWTCEKDPVPLARDLQAAGLDRVLWSNEERPDDLRDLNALGYLTGRYDIYQDVMDPAQYPRLKAIHPDWPAQAWPADLVLDQAGAWVKGWEVETKEGNRIPCGVVNDERALPMADGRISQDLADHPYGARFIDTATASPWREDWSPDHPLTRTQSKEWRMKLLDLVSGKYHLVTGSETGQDAAVPYVSYFEGMESLAPYRVADAGRNIGQTIEPAPDQITRFQVGWKYRLPLWELVYHDCVVAYWYWGDYSNKVPSVWPLRDLFNALYGTPPVYVFDRKTWNASRDQFAASYALASATARKTVYAAMTDFQVLTPDRSVQRTVFSDGTTVTVNFGTGPWTLETGKVLGPGKAVW